MSDFRIQCDSCGEKYSLPDSWKDSLSNKELTCDACQKTWVPFPATGLLRSAPTPLPIELSVYRVHESDTVGSATRPNPTSPSHSGPRRAMRRAQLPVAKEPGLLVVAAGPGIDVRAVYALGSDDFLIGQSGCHLNLPTESIPQRAVVIRRRREGFTFEGLGGFRPQVGTDPAITGVIATGKRVQMKIGSTTLLFEVSSKPGSSISELVSAERSSSARTSPANRQSSQPPARTAPYPNPQTGSEALDGTVLDMMAEGVGRFTKSNPLDGLEIGLIFLEGPNKGKGYHVRKTPTLIGRTTGDLKIPDRRVSRKHAQLDIIGLSQYSLKDLASTNGTLVNDRPISTTRLENGDTVSFGGIKFKFMVKTIRTASTDP